MTATVPSGETGFVTVETSTGHLTSNAIFRVIPTLTGFTPTSGKVGDTVVINGTGLIQTTNITVGNQRVAVYTVNSDSKLTTKVPVGATTGKIVITTPGNKITISGTFTVTP
jgi:IPT/TIG domain